MCCKSLIYKDNIILLQLVVYSLLIYVLTTTNEILNFLLSHNIEEED
jgi:hypothetical protein